MIQHVETQSGTVYTIDAEKKLILRLSERPLVSFEQGWEDNVSGAWKSYSSVGFEGGSLAVIYADGQWSLSTRVVSVTDPSGTPQDFLITGPAFLAGVNEKYDAVEVPRT